LSITGSPSQSAAAEHELLGQVKLVRLHVPSSDLPARLCDGHPPNSLAYWPWQGAVYWHFPPLHAQVPGTQLQYAS
jgi:hypothetical protein